MFRFRKLFFLLTTLILPFALSAEPANLAQLRNEVKAYYDTGTYTKELNQVITQAKTYILQRAKENSHSVPHKKLAIVLDIDETSLSNYHRMAARNFSATNDQLRNDVMAADAPEIQSTLSLYQEALKQGISVFFVTGRKESQRLVTIKNLNKSGYHDWKGLFLKPDNYNLASTIPFKSKIRAKITEMGYTIIASIGDQYSDLKGGFAEKTYKLPNPFYYLP